MKKRDNVVRKEPSCREHSCNRPRGFAGFCQKHKEPQDRHHDRKLLMDINQKSWRFHHGIILNT